MRLDTFICTRILNYKTKIWRRFRSVWNDYWRTTQKSIVNSNNNNNNDNNRPRNNPYAPSNPYSTPQPFTVTTAFPDARLAQLQPQLLLQQQQPPQQLPQHTLPGNNNPNEDPLALLLKNKYFQHSGLQELKTVSRPQSLLDHGPFGE